jgi:hypothetical protein
MTRKTVLFVPPSSTILNHPVVKNLGSKYQFIHYDEQGFDTFYKIASYDNFCNDLNNIEDFLNPRYLTMITLDDDDVFAVLNFQPLKARIYIHLFCGNQSLPRSGEGTKLLAILEKAMREENFFDLVLDSVRETVDYYKNNGFHLRNNTDKQRSYTIDLEKNLRAASNWSKIRSSLAPNDTKLLSIMYSKRKNSRAKGLKGLKGKKGIKTKGIKGKKTKGIKGKKTKSRKIRKL